MNVLTMPLRAATALVASLALAACGTTQTMVSQTAPTPYTGPATESGRPLIEQLQWAASGVRPDVVFMVGACEDKTGQHKDAEALRYSTAVTQACPDILANYLRMAGFQVAERSPYNMGLIAQEYQLSHQFAAPQPGQQTQGSPVNIGLIQRGGPNGGLMGANYMVTGAITTYSSSVGTGGGGVDLDGIGVSGRTSEAIVGITLRIVDVSSGLTVSSLYLQSTITGTTSSFHITRFIGNVVSTLATVTGGTAATTILRPTSDVHIASAEFGSSLQLPADYAVTDVIVANLARQIEVNQHLFYQTPPAPFDYNVAPH